MGERPKRQEDETGPKHLNETRLEVLVGGGGNRTDSRGNPLS